MLGYLHVELSSGPCRISVSSAEVDKPLTENELIVVPSIPSVVVVTVKNGGSYKNKTS